MCRGVAPPQVGGYSPQTSAPRGTAFKTPFRNRIQQRRASVDRDGSCCGPAWAAGIAQQNPAVSGGAPRAAKLLLPRSGYVNPGVPTHRESRRASPPGSSHCQLVLLLLLGNFSVICTSEVFMKTKPKTKFLEHPKSILVPYHPPPGKQNKTGVGRTNGSNRPP